MTRRVQVGDWVKHVNWQYHDYMEVVIVDDMNDCFYLLYEGRPISYRQQEGKWIFRGTEVRRKRKTGFGKFAALKMPKEQSSAKNTRKA